MLSVTSISLPRVDVPTRNRDEQFVSIPFFLLSGIKSAHTPLLYCEGLNSVSSVIYFTYVFLQEQFTELTNSFRNGICCVFDAYYSPDHNVLLALTAIVPMGVLSSFLMSAGCGDFSLLSWSASRVPSCLRDCTVAV